MKIYHKVYAVYGMLEWVCQITSGKAQTTIHFEGGATSTLGVTPALYKTDNPIIQHMIENSSFFKNGKIHLYTTMDTGREIPDAVPSTKEETTEVAIADEATEKKVVNVADYDEAKDYLADNCQVLRTQMRSKSAILEQASLHGIEFNGLE